MPLNKHVMTTAFRTGLTKVYRDALIGAKVGADNADIKPHINGTATVTLTDAQLEKLRKARGADMIELSSHSNAGRITILLPEGEQYLASNRPTLTDAERSARRSKGTGGRGISEEERQRRDAVKARLDALLQSQHGIDLAENKADAPDSADAETEADEE